MNNLNNQMVIDLLHQANYDIDADDIFRPNKDTNILCFVLDNNNIIKVEILDSHASNPIYNIFITNYINKEYETKIIDDKDNSSNDTLGIITNKKIEELLKDIDSKSEVFQQRSLVIYKTKMHTDVAICFGIGEIAIITRKRSNKLKYEIKRYKSNELEDLNNEDNINKYYHISEDDKPFNVNENKYNLNE